MNLSAFIAQISAVGAGAVLLASCAPADHPDQAAAPELTGRTAGPARRCVLINTGESLRIIGPDKVIYGSGKTVWVNDLRTSCPGMDRMDVLVVQPLAGQYCNGDRVQILHPTTNSLGAECLLGDFIPYERSPSE